jgi:hypothetical protein
MRTFKLVAALALVLVSSAIAVASASAVEILWRWLPGSAKETFTGKSGQAKLVTVGGKKIVCTKSLVLLTFGEASSELLEKEAKLALALIHFEGCKAEGILPVNSEGDEKEIILVHLELHNCLIKKGDNGILFLPLPVHLVVPSVGLTIEVTGSFVGLISALTGDKKHYELNIKQSANGVQEFKLCEGGAEESLKSKDDTAVAENASEDAAEGLVLFDGTIDKAGEELMEN